MVRPGNRDVCRRNGVPVTKRDKKSWPRRCAHKYCRNLVQKSHKALLCPKHHSAAFKAKSPLRYHFNLLRCAAKQRAKPFLLKYEEYEKLARESGYNEQRGREATSLSIDRIENDLGYSIDNIRIIVKSENSSKAHRRMYVPHFQSLSDSDKADTDDSWTDLPSHEGQPF
jgi:hypothetical protein